MLSAFFGISMQSFTKLVGVESDDFHGVSWIRSINQISKAPKYPAEPGSVARQPNRCSTAKSKKRFCNINRPSERPSQRDVSRYLFDLATKLIERTDSGRFFQRVKCSITSIGLDHRDWQLSLFYLNEWDGSDVASMEWRETGCFSCRFCRIQHMRALNIGERRVNDGNFISGKRADFVPSTEE